MTLGFEIQIGRQTDKLLILRKRENLVWIEPTRPETS